MSDPLLPLLIPTGRLRRHRTPRLGRHPAGAPPLTPILPLLYPNSRVRGRIPPVTFTRIIIKRSTGHTPTRIIIIN